MEFHLYALVRQRVAQSYFTTHHEHIAFSDVLVVMVMASSRTSRALFIAGLMILVLACLVRASDNDQPATTTADGATDANSTVRTTIHCQYCDVYVCLSVCLSVCPLAYILSRKPHGRTSPNFLCVLHVAAARSSSGGVAICYVLPVLWMTSFFHTTVLRRCVFISDESVRNSLNCCIDSYQIFADNVKDRQHCSHIYRSCVANRAKSAIDDCLV